MKVGILTFPGSPSYGASLQMVGMYKTLQELGCSVEVINYMNMFMKKKKHIPGNTSTLRKMIRSFRTMPKVKKFREFEEILSLNPKRQTHDPQELKDICKNYDYVICGSDQVWNPLVTGSDYSYFLDYIEDASRKVAYAPSFGVTKLNDKDANYIKEALQNFDHISVREEAGRDIIRSLIGCDCPVVLDPSMLITKEEWRKLENEVLQLPDHYIFYFMLNNVPYVKAFAEELSDCTGYPIVNVCGTVDKNRFTGRNMSLIGPAEWLYAMDNASYVITDSFHGTAFSILFEKENFISLASSTNSRIITLINSLGMSDRVLYEESRFESFPKTDYCKVKKLLEIKRTAGIDYLKSSLDISNKK